MALSGSLFWWGHVFLLQWRSGKMWGQQKQPKSTWILKESCGGVDGERVKGINIHWTASNCQHLYVSFNIPIALWVKDFYSSFQWGNYAYNHICIKWCLLDLVSCLLMLNPWLYPPFQSASWADWATKLGFMQKKYVFCIASCMFHIILPYTELQIKPIHASISSSYIINRNFWHWKKPYCLLHLITEPQNKTDWSTKKRVHYQLTFTYHGDWHSLIRCCGRIRFILLY